MTPVRAIISPLPVSAKTGNPVGVRMILVGLQFGTGILPKSEKGSKANGQAGHVDEGEEWVSHQQAKGEFEVVE